jgi:hypothetical protein
LGLLEEWSTVTPAALDPEDAKLVTLARSARVRSVVGDGLAAEGAAVRDETGRTYVAATVVRGPLRLPALHLAVASALASGAKSFEAAVVVTGQDEPAGVDVLESIGAPTLFVADASGEVRRSG